MTRKCLFILAIGLLSFFGACSKSQPDVENQNQLAPIDHVGASKPLAPINFLHKTFTVKTHEAFEFNVPAHIIRPALRGTFESFAKNAAGDLLSNQNADVDLLILNDQEFDDFLHNRQGHATYTVDPSHSQTVTYAVHSTVVDAQKYHLVFSNSPGGARIKLVKADFTVSFE
jgi:hypothetical protein